jgi:hypothetical protein
MEILKDSLIVDKNYLPKLSYNHIDYFNRAMAFAQTNYQDELVKINKTNFYKMTPNFFFNEYIWCICCAGINVKTASIIVKKVQYQAEPLYHLFYSNNIIEVSEVRDNLLSALNNPVKVDAIIKTAKIIKDAINLFDWSDYKNNYLISPKTLCALPMIGEKNNRHLAKNIGLPVVVGGKHMQTLIDNWGFVSTEEMCRAIQKHFPSIKISIIGMILWYSMVTFGKMKS